jgi:hypothetical protein
MVAAAPARGNDSHQNAWGIYAAPIMYGFAQGSQYDLAADGNALDFGAYYTRFIGSRFSARLEVRFGQRQIDATQYITGSPWLYFFRLDETFVEFPLMVHSERRTMFGDREARLSIGGGAVFTAVLDQELLLAEGESPLLTAGEYQKFGWTVDAGLTVDVGGGAGVFALLRYQRDESVFGESEDADVQRRFEAWGMHVGLESGF